jgi:alginate production protein
VRLAILLTLLWLVASAPPARAERVFDPDDPPDTRYQLAPYLTFGAELEVEYFLRRNLDLLDRRRDDLSVLKTEGVLALSFDPAPGFQAFLNVALSRAAVLADRAGTSGEREDLELEVKEAFVRVGLLSAGPALVIGRQRFDDERKWLYDEELDAVRFRYAERTLTVELSVSRDALVRRDLLDRKGEPEQTTNYILHGGYGFENSIELEGYAILRDDRAEDRRPFFLGLRSRGEPVTDLDYWVELAYAGGRDGSRSISGWGVDVGAIYEWQRGPKPSVTLGLAFGSGDRRPDDSRDGSFRQTGLHKNEGDFGGSTEFKFYGEVMDPELSNLAIFTVGVGVRPSDRFSVDLVYHYYLQHRAASTLRSAGLEAEPSGRSRRLGSEIDLVIGLVEILDRLDVKAVAGYFFPGSAFPRADGAWIVGSEVQFRF